MRLSNCPPVLPRAVFLAWAACGFACGGDDTDRGPRLEWDQPAESAAQAQALSFRLYVDNVGRPLNGAACRVTTGAAGHVCAAPLPQLGPGRHVLQLSSVLNGVESPRSEPIDVSGDAGQLTGQLNVARPEVDPQSSAPSMACLMTTATECYAVHVVASGLSGVSALSPAPDGRLFLIEGNARVRVVADGSLITEPALALRDEGARLTGLTVDAWSFPERRFVFVAWTDETRSNQLQLNVTRYREVANTLGEGATILTGIPVPRDVPSSPAVDRNGHVYVAVPASDSGPSSAGAGVVLRITRDGRVPPDNRLGLPVLVSGFSLPTSISVDPGQRRVWLGGQNPGSPYGIGVVSALPSEQAQSIHLFTQVASDRPVSFVLSKTDESSAPAMFVVADGRLSKALRAQDGSVTGYMPLDLGDLRVTTAVATENGSMFVATETSIFELRRLPIP
jgi:glucose/sorbosone dehydrogenase